MKPGFTQLAGLATILLLAQTPLARADDPTETNPQPYRCEDSVITKVGNYFEDDPTSGFYALFASKLGVENFSDSRAAVVDRSAGQDSVMAKQRVGDKVQVCLINTPEAGYGCNPNKDPRGRVYRVFNYRLRGAYSGWNSNHGCGGA
jgi:hypothetical protein